MRPLQLALTASLLLSLGAPAQGFRQPDSLGGRPSFESPDGQPLRQVRLVSWDAQGGSAQWKSFLGRAGGRWRSIWDRATRIPLRIYGTGLAAPGTTTWDLVGELHARAVLDAHLDLLAPGAVKEDFVLVSNHLSGGLRTVGFQQLHQGLPVLGGQVSFRFKQDRLVVLASEALPWVRAEKGPWIAPELASQKALAYLRSDFPVPTRTRGVTGPLVLPLVPEQGTRGRIGYSVVWVVDLQADSLPGRWDVYVEAATGRPVARRQTLRFASGQILYNVPSRWPGAEREDAPAAWTDATADGTWVTGDADGVVTFDGSGPAEVAVFASGPYAAVQNEAGADASATLSLEDGGSATWNVSQDEFADAQLTSFIHVNRAKAFVWAMGVELPWLSQRMQVTVNIDDTCNAYSDGQTINFFRASNWCENTGRLADVIYHEFGHSLHLYSMLPGAGAFDEALSEGLADTLAASITGDSGMGRGFFHTSEPLREIDPTGEEAFWPDDMGQDPHTTGLIISGALWDLRKALIEDLGEDEGVSHLLRIFYAIMQRASDIPSAYVEALAEDDDDGDLSNGTPNLCAIQRAFAAHGIAGNESMVGGLLLGSPTLEDRTVAVSVQDMGAACDQVSLESATLRWSIRDQAYSGSEEMLPADDSYSAELPEVAEGNVLKYQVELAFSDGSTRIFPRNPADPYYETFVGAVFPLYCTDFERDPELDGWTHGLSGGTPSEGADDWMWGPPRAGVASGDPPAAFSGERVLGNDLGGGSFNGLYQASKRNWAASPVIDASLADVVRVQFRRWLSVEDGYFDKATIYGNTVPLWQNTDSNQGEASAVHHQDHEWRFQDVDLTSAVDDFGRIQVKFELESDGGLQMGGWTLDDLCIVAWIPPRCGDGRVSTGEECDDGTQNSNTEPDACRTRCLLAHCGDGVVDTGEECDDGNAEDGDGCSSTCEAEEPVKPAPGCGCGAATQAPGPDPGPALGLLLVFLVALVRRRR
ncbi:MAG: MYXO-CTERM sorting domain-containing protein [Polyangia bacterium]|nr:MYXO-CTERM sorting domain-containing protein [Polyangia bacterium]